MQQRPRTMGRRSFDKKKIIAILLACLASFGFAFGESMSAYCVGKWSDALSIAERLGTWGKPK